jgi:flagellar hook assembly protein FlgD
MKQAKLIILCLFLVSCMSVKGQITLTASTKKANKGDLVSTEIMVKSRDTISLISFDLQWDSTILSFQKIENFNLPQAQYDTFGLTNVKKGLLKFTWLGNEDYLIKDSIMIFKVNFKVVGEKGTNSPIRFVKPKAYNVKIDTIPLTFLNGAVMVNNTSAVGQVWDTEGYVQLGQSQPNPASSNIVIPFTLIEADEVTLKIYDLAGKQVYTQKKRVSAGNHNFEFNTEGVLSRGVFVYGIETKKGFTGRILIKI